MVVDYSNIWKRFSRMAFHIKYLPYRIRRRLKQIRESAPTADDVIANLKGHEDEFDALVFSCGDAVPVFQQNADKPYNVDLMQVIKTFGAKGKMMIGHCAGAMMFDFTGITKGKKVAVHPLAKPAIQNGTATDKKSEIDGNFLLLKMKTPFGQ